MIKSSITRKFMYIGSLLFSLIILSSAALAQTLDSSFATPTALNDQQAKAAQKFRHEGQRAAIVDEACRTNPTACDQNKVGEHGQVLMNSAIEDNIGKLYALMFGGGIMMGKPPQVKVTSTKAEKLEAAKPTTGGEAAKKDKKTGNDYCIYAAVGYETIAGLTQQAMQQKAAESTPNLDPQRASLVNLREMHKARQRTSKYQAAIYAATSSCYAARFVMGQTVMDPSYAIKMGAAGGLTYLYAQKSKKHKQAVTFLDGVISRLDGAGKCDPWTGTTCFCGQATSQQLYAPQYQEVCVLNKGNLEAPKAAMGCGVMVNGKMTLDKACKCKQNNTCFKGNLQAYNPEFNLGKNFMNQANKGFEELSSGDFDEGRLDKYNLQTASHLGHLKDKIKSNIPGVNLNPDQQKTADSLAGIVPPAIAALAASSPGGNAPGGGLMGGSERAALDKIPDTLKDKVKEVDGNYKKGSGINEISSDDGQLNLPQLPGSEARDGTEVVSFAEQAINKADVTNSPHTPIFDIISNRYRRSAWNKFSLEQE